MRAVLLALALLAAPAALAQTGVGATPPQHPQQTQQAPGLPGGDPAIQSTAPETGAGRGGPNAQQPESSEPQQPTGGARPAEPQATAPRAPAPTTPIPAPKPLAAREPFDAGELEARMQGMLRGGTIDGAVSIPNQSAGILVQPQGRDWRQFRSRVLAIGGIVLIAGAVIGLGLFYLLRGPTRIDAGRSGRKVQRFTLAERANHWMVATSFVLLALTGLNITYGAHVLRPLIGPQAFTALTFWGQAAHHYLAFAFMLGVLVMLAHWARENLIRRVDIAWIRQGGPLAKHHPPAGKFNAGQKLLYWFTMLGGLAVSASGVVLMAPGLLDDVNAQQWAHIAHGVVAMGMIAVILGHIYIGSFGMEGAFEAMRDGQVDTNWAREHHGRWLEEEVARARAEVAPDALPGRRAAGAD